MIEDSVESFILQYKPYAITAEIVASNEGNPLIECVVQTKVLHFLERTAPYLSAAGKRNIILNCSTEALSICSEPQKSFEVTGLSKLKARGLVLEQHGENLILDAGITFIVSSFTEPSSVAVGDWVEFECIAPIHGFVLSELGERPRYVEEDSI